MKFKTALLVAAVGLGTGLWPADMKWAKAQAQSQSPGNLLTSDAQFTSEEFARILQHGPWPMPSQADPSNRVSGRATAIRFGKMLFFEKKLSANGLSSCATCHVPEKLFTDGRKRGEGFVELDRNTPGLLDVRLNRWFGWDGAADSLWAQSLRPIVDKREMAASTTHVGKLVRRDARLKAAYRDAFGRSPPDNDDIVTVNAGKALAAFQETLASGRTAFDEFRDALARGDREAMKRYPQAAQRGLKIFVGQGNCSVCHFGPNFTNGEFGDIGIPFFAAPGRVDPGRYEGISKLLESRANLLGAYNDDPRKSSATGTRHVNVQHRNWGEFRVPSLRNAAKTAPYMHNGHLATLGDVVRYYSELNEDRLHADGEKILKPLKLSPAQVDDLVAFLESLTSLKPVPY
jgi:cytochrome c peroxidase